MSTNIPRLDYGFLSQSLDPINVMRPWQNSTRDGLFKMNYKPEDAERDNLLFWAKTNKGEYVMDPNFGLDIRRYIFGPIPILKDNVIQNAREQLPIYFPNVTAIKVEILTTEDNPDINDNAVIFKFEGHIKTDKKRYIRLEETIGQ